MVISYVPVLHAGYRRFFDRQRSLGAATLYVLGDDVLEGFHHLLKDLRRLTADEASRAIRALGLFETVTIADRNLLRMLPKKGWRYVLPDEPETRELAAQYLVESSVEFDQVFLRWHRSNVEQPQAIRADREIRASELGHTAIAAVRQIAAQSADWWRQVGAAVLHAGQVILVARNMHVPDDRQHLYNGDPRALFSKGVGYDLSTALHAEADLVAQAARQGKSLQDCDLVVTDFPCPACAKLVAYCGFKRLFFLQGYAVLDGEHVLRARGVEIIRVLEEEART